MKRGNTLLFCAACLLVGNIGCGRGDSEPPAPQANPFALNLAPISSHERMIVALRSYRKQQESDPYLGTGALKIAQAMLESDPRAADPDFRLTVFERLGQHELRLGMVERALPHLKEACELALRDDLNLDSHQRSEHLYRLAVGYLRLAENENCVDCRNGESCILPIVPAGVHEKVYGAQQAAKLFRQVLDLNPDNDKARWLLNICAMILGEFPQAIPLEDRLPAFPQADFPRFVNISADLKLDTVSLSGGAIGDDFDGDGDFDLLVSSWDNTTQIRFFRNNGDGTFTDDTERANLVGILGGLNMLQADYDNDGDLDVYVLRGAWHGENGRHVNSLLQNDGHGRFTDVAFDVGLGEGLPTQTAAWADFDLDGDVDLYVGNEHFASQLFRNDGADGFVDVAAEAGVENRRCAKGVIWGDIDNDGDPDLYISNYESANRLYLNRGDGTFEDVAESRGVTDPIDSLPVWFWDYNNDGALDIFVGSYTMNMDAYAADAFGKPVVDVDRDQLYEGDGRGGFRRVADQMGLARVSDVMGCNFGDLDNDGWLDFYLGTGAPGFDFLVPNLMYRNVAGKRFENVTYSGGFGHLQKGHAVVFADFDRDGDQDIFQEMGGAFAGDAFANSYFQNPGFDNQWLGVKLEGVATNRCGLGAVIHVWLRDGDKLRQVVRVCGAGGGFGGNPLQQHFGLGTSAIDRVEVYWPVTGTTQVIRDVRPNQVIHIKEVVDTARTSNAKR
jgi:tetratricopeptide (TPR) repeat protein